MIITEKTNSLIPEEQIMSKILVLRNQKVMIDRDLADLFGIETKRLNEQVKRNIKRFPQRFMFKLTIEEKEEVVAICDYLACAIPEKGIFALKDYTVYNPLYGYDFTS